MGMGVLIEYALLNDKETPIHIKNAYKDPVLRYYCEGCKEELIVRHGVEKRKHFAHKSNGSHCLVSIKGNGESIIHKYWKQHYASLSEILLPFYSLDKKENKLVIKWARHKIKSSVMEKSFKLRDGRTLRPDVLLTLENGKQIALEIWFTNKKAYKYKWAFAEVGVPAYEIRVKGANEEDNEISILYSPDEYSLRESINDDLVAAEIERADNFVQSIYRVVEKWEKKNRWKATVPRYTYYLKRANDEEEEEEPFLFRTTYKTYLRVLQSYGRLFEIREAASLVRRIEKDKQGLI